MLDPRLVELLAAELNTNPGLIEKDWHVVRALGVLAGADYGEVTPIFSGGTSLSKGWGVIKRFSEDIDFKLAMPETDSRSKDRNRRKSYRNHILSVLAAAGFTLADEVRKGDEDRFFSADFAYPSVFEAARGLRPHLRIEMSFGASALPPVERPIRSLLAEAQRHEPEVAGFPCVDPVETAADKLSALAWRVCTREPGSERDDPTMIRHLHDLAALADRIEKSASFSGLVREIAGADTGRGGGKAPELMAERFAMMLDRLEREKFWADDYTRYVRQVSFAKPEEAVGFGEAVATLKVILTRL